MDAPGGGPQFGTERGQVMTGPPRFGPGSRGRLRGFAHLSGHLLLFGPCVAEIRAQAVRLRGRRLGLGGLPGQHLGLGGQAGGRGRCAGRAGRAG